MKAKFPPFAVAFLLTGLSSTLAIQPGMAGTIQEQVSVLPGKQLTARDEQVISAAGAKVLRHIAQARADIRHADSTATRLELAQAEKLLDIIHEALPSSTVKDRIWVAKKHMEYEDTQQVLPDLIPIYSSLNEMMDIMPVKEAKAQLDQAKKHLKAGDKAAAREALDETDAALQYTEIDLPLSTTRHLIAQAKAALANKNSQGADKFLEQAENSVIFTSVGIEQPLFAAKAALYQGLMDIEDGKTSQAQQELQNARQLLAAAKQSPDAATREAAQQLLDETRLLQKDLGNGSNGVVAGFHRLVEHAQAYADRAVEYLAVGWEHFKSDHAPLKADLIEAKLHIKLAQIDKFTAAETAKAAKQLEIAESYLKKGIHDISGQANAQQLKAEIGDLQKSVTAMRDQLSKSLMSQYTQVQQQLDKLIGQA